MAKFSKIDPSQIKAPTRPKKSEARKGDDNPASKEDLGSKVDASTGAGSNLGVHLDRGGKAESHDAGFPDLSAGGIDETTASTEADDITTAITDPGSTLGTNPNATADAGRFAPPGEHAAEPSRDVASVETVVRAHIANDEPTLINDDFGLADPETGELVEMTPDTATDATTGFETRPDDKGDTLLAGPNSETLVIEGDGEDDTLLAGPDGEPTVVDGLDDDDVLLADPETGNPVVIKDKPDEPDTTSTDGDGGDEGTHGPSNEDDDTVDDKDDGTDDDTDGGDGGSDESTHGPSSDGDDDESTGADGNDASQPSGEPTGAENAATAQWLESIGLGSTVAKVPPRSGTIDPGSGEAGIDTSGGADVVSNDGLVNPGGPNEHVLGDGRDLPTDGAIDPHQDDVVPAEDGRLMDPNDELGLGNPTLDADALLGNDSPDGVDPSTLDDAPLDRPIVTVHDVGVDRGEASDDDPMGLDEAKPPSDDGKPEDKPEEKPDETPEPDPKKEPVSDHDTEHKTEHDTDFGKGDETPEYVIGGEGTSTTESDELIIDTTANEDGGDVYLGEPTMEEPPPEHDTDDQAMDSQTMDDEVDDSEGDFDMVDG